MFGFITAQALPQLCDFYIYVPEGSIQVTVKVNRLVVTLTEKQIQNFRIFHYYIFKDVLGILEDFLIFNNDENAEMLLLIPVYKQCNIYGMNFDILQMTKTLSCKNDNNDNKKAISNIHNKSLLGAVVTMQSTNGNYLVCALSCNAEIKGRLLTKEINYLKPTIQKVVHKNIKPSSCFVQEFPPNLWLQAGLLPSVLYRITTILLANELRQTITRETGLGDISSNLYKIWLPLTFKENPREIMIVPTMQDNSIISTKCGLEYVYKTLKDRHNPQLNSQFISTCYKMILSQMLLTEDIEKQSTSPFTFESLKSYTETEIKLLKPKGCNDGTELISMIKALTGVKCIDIIDYERAETLGDAFLKFTVSLFIFLKYPNYNEGKASVLKSCIISNKNLFYAGLDNKLFKYTRNTAFNSWKPPGFTIPIELKQQIDQKETLTSFLSKYTFGRNEKISGILFKELEWYCTKATNNQIVHDCFLEREVLTNKTIADCVEALIGIYFEACGLQAGLNMLTWLKIMPPSVNIDNLFNLHLINPLRKLDATDSDIDLHIPSWSKIEDTLGYKFNNRAYLLQALTHSSYNCNYLTDCYQRLEFLGDAILDFLITCHIYETYENLNSGELTDLRSALVNNVTFAAFSVRCGFYKFLLLSSKKLLESIDSFVHFQESRDFSINDTVLILMEEDDVYMAENVEVPKALGDIFESLIAAVFLDCGMDFKIAWKIIYRLIWREIEQFAKNVPKDSVRLLNEATKANPHYHAPIVMDTGATMVAIDISLPMNKKQTVYGFGENKRCAKKAAAKLALRLLNKN